MRPAASLALVAMLLVGCSSSATAQPTIICTQIAIPFPSDDPMLALVRGAPLDGECDMTVYLPLAILDPAIMRELGAIARGNAEAAASSERVAAMTCDELNNYRATADDVGDRLMAFVEHQIRCKIATPPP